MAFLEDVTKGGRAVGQGLLDVLGAIASPAMPILEQIPQINAAYQLSQGNPLPAQMLQQEQNRNLLQNLAQMQGGGQQGTAQQIQMTPTLQSAIQSGDTNAFNKEVSQQRRRSTALENVLSSSLPDEEKQILSKRLFAGDNPDDVYKQFESARTRQAMQTQKQAAAVESEQRQVRTMQKAQEIKKAAKTEASIPNQAKLFAKENPDASAEQWAGWLRLQGVKPANVDQTIKDLENLKIKKADPSWWSSVKNTFSNLFSGSTQAPQQQGFSIIRLE